MTYVQREVIVAQMKTMIQEFVADLDQIAEQGEFPKTMEGLALYWLKIACNLPNYTDERIHDIIIELRAARVNAMHMLEEVA